MWECETSVEIAAPMDQVYSYLADFRRHADWASGLAEIEPISNGHLGVGSEFKAVETIPGTFVSYSRVTALEPPRRIAWEAWDGRVMRTTWAFELAPVEGGTRLVQRCGFEPTNLLGRLALNLMRKGRVPRENQQSLERIKAILEGGQETAESHGV
jgi:uncharacterized membrane protein